MGPFFDTGVALKVVVSEPLSRRVLDFVKKRRAPVPISRLIELEMETALKAMAFRGHTPPSTRSGENPALGNDV